MDGRTIPYEIRHKVFRILSSDSLKAVRLVCKEWMFQVEFDGLINPIFDDRQCNNSLFCYSVKHPKFLTISHLRQVDDDFLSWTNYLQHLHLRCSIQFSDFGILTSYLSKLELSGRFFSEQKLSWNINTKVVLPCLKILVIKVFFPTNSLQSSQVQSHFIGKTLAKDIKELIMLANLKIILQSLKTAHLEQFEFKSSISNSMTLIGDTEESEDESVTAYDKQLDTKEFICRNLKHLRRLQLDFLDRIYLDKLYLPPAPQLTEIYYKLHDSQSYKYDEKIPLPEYFWSQFIDKCKLYKLRILHFESFRVSVPLEKLMNQLEHNYLEEFSFTGKLNAGSNVLNVRGNPIQVKGGVKIVDRVSCTIFENMLNLKKVELRFLKQAGVVQLLHLNSLPPALQHISIKDTVVLPAELSFIKGLRFLKSFTYCNLLLESFNTKSNRIFCTHIQSFLQMRSLQNVKISPLFSEIPIGPSYWDKNSRPKKKLFWGKEKTKFSVNTFKEIAEINNIVTKKGLNSYAVSL